jgi:hypothetical protein
MTPGSGGGGRGYDMDGRSCDDPVDALVSPECSSRELSWPGRRPNKTMPRLYLALVALLLLSQCRTGPDSPRLGRSSPSLQMPATSPWSAHWEKQFQTTSGWTGGDVGRSVLLPDGRVLWLFGDSWVGPVHAGRHIAGSTMVANAIALSSKLNGVWTTEFHYGRKADASPAAWIRPEPRVVEQFTSPNGHLIYWLTGDGFTTETGSLTLFADMVFKEEGGGTWGFESRKSVLLEIAAWSEPADSWRVSQKVVPWSGPQEEGPSLNWGIAIARECGHTFIYGRRQHGKKTALIVAKAPEDAVGDFESWRFWTADGWSKSPRHLEPLFGGVSMEPSVHPWADGHGAGWILLESAPGLAPRVVVRFAPSPTGPWSCPVPLIEIDSVVGKPRLFAAQAKIHPHLRQNESHLISWVVNAHDFWDIAGNADLYRPRFRQMPMNRLRDAAKRARSASAGGRACLSD